MTGTRGHLATFTATLALGVFLVGAATSPGAALAESSVWWGLSSGARPTNLAGATGKDEVFHLSVSATAGDYLVAGAAPFVVEVVPFDASAAVVHEKLQATVPNRRFSVEESVELETHLYTITFPSQPGVEPPGLIGSAPFVEEFAELFANETATALSGGKAEVAMTQVQSGKRSEDEVSVIAQNRGFAASTGPVTLTDSLPAGLEAVSVSGISGVLGTFRERQLPECSLKPLRCTFAGNCTEEEREQGKCALPPFELLEMRVVVVPHGARSGEVNTGSVSGGGAPGTVTASHALQAGTPRRFGVEDWALVPENLGGSIDTQAGSHPFQLTNVVTLNSTTPEPNTTGFNPRSAGLVKDISGELPPGLLGNPTPFVRCTDAQFARGILLQSGPINACPEKSAVGVAAVTFTQPRGLQYITSVVPIFNITPRPGEPLRFGFKAGGVVSAFLDSKLRTGGDFGATITSSNIFQGAYVLGVRLTFWGVPGDPRHDSQRGWNCLEHLGGCPTTTAENTPPFLVMPTSCAAPFASTVHADSWGSSTIQAEVAEPVTAQLQGEFGEPIAIDGCNHLPFEPSLSVTPDGSAASSPSGLTADVHVPQTSVLQPQGLAQSAVKDITVALPEGLRLNPAAADGLTSCSQAQIDLQSPEEARCPNSSKIGSVIIRTPLLPNPLSGFVYLASPQNFAGPPQENPFSSLIAMYLTAKDPVSGVLIKLPGEVSLSETGQVTATFRDSPQAPFEDAELKFFGGDRAPLATPSYCGSYTTSASFAPWSGNEPVDVSAPPFSITSGNNGAPCVSPLAFSPSLAAGTTNNDAGAFSPLTTTVSRPDGDQDIQAVQLHMPPGLSGILASVKLCPEAEANAGTCGPESLIGHTIVSVGLGGDPFSVTGGEVFLTEKYGGGQFGLAIVNPAVAGPFDLGKVIVRAKIEVDPHTAALTITTSEIPHILKGIPLQIKHVNVTIDRPGFTFNPTNCTPMAIAGTIGSTEAASSLVSVPFQVTNCANLKFAPKFQISTSGRTSKARGASLTAKISYPSAPQGTQANIAKVKVELPKQLPSRLTTLQKACTSAQFDANPAGCPAASIIGHATLHTPLLPVALTGPAYFVSHGGEAFPSLVVVLQGYGVTIDLVGTTFISKAGVTSTTFKTAPDAPFTTFELTLPQGRFSALAANGNLCTSKLRMPNEFIAQNGAAIHQSTPITVTNCKHHKHKHTTKRHR